MRAGEAGLESWITCIPLAFDPPGNSLKGSPFFPTTAASHREEE